MSPPERHCQQGSNLQALNELSKWVKINKEKRAKAEKAQKVSPYNAPHGEAVRRVHGICSIPI